VRPHATEVIHAGANAQGSVAKNLMMRHTPSAHAQRRSSSPAILILGAALSLWCTGFALAQTPANPGQVNPNLPANGADESGPVRLRQAPPPTIDQDREATDRTDSSRDAASESRGRGRAPVRLYQPSEFESFVQRLSGELKPIRRVGAELLTPSDEPSASDAGPLVPPDYLIKPGDDLQVTLWGSVDADLRARVDRSGRITIPRVGPVQVAGVRYADVNDTVSQRVAKVFRNFQVSVSLARVQAQRVYVTGFVARPGALNVSSLASAVQALLQAGGPSPAGSFRLIEVRRGKERVATIDLYEFLLKGDRSGDRLLQPEDVVHVGAIGTQAALIGSVNRPGVFELKAGETFDDLVRMAGGFSAVADRSRLAVERLDDRASVRIAQLAWPESASAQPKNGDVLRAFSAVDVALPVQRQNKRVRIEGEVARPGDYVLPPDSSLADALATAGGMTAAAYPFGTEFTRESVRTTQQQNYERALRDLETDLARNTSTQRASSADEAAAQNARDSANARLLTSLRAIRPNGRVVLQMQPGNRELPALTIEDGDRLYIPPRPTSVGVFGSVFNAGSYLHSSGRAIGDYLGLAGGPTRGADASSTFVIRANGSVVSGLQSSNWLGRDSNLTGMPAEPGDTVFVPEELNKTTFVQNAKDWTQILYQFGLGIAGIVAAGR
jgi:protein involved in polysaccharide export with SLBB domain